MTEYRPYIKKLQFSKKIVDNDFNLIESGFENQPILSLGYHYYTKQVREKMNIEEFKNRKFYLIVNNFENDIPDHDELIDKKINSMLKLDKSSEILSRDFFKLWEIIIYYNLCADKSLKSVSLSENGGFLQAISYFRSNYLNTKTDTYCYQGGTKSEIAECLKETIKKNKLIKLEGPLETYNKSGFLTKVKSIEDFIKSNKLSDVNLITANGIIDFMENSNQEHQLYTLILGEIITALSIQKDGGDFILRIEDCFTNVTLKLLNILGDCYEKVDVCKPLFSRPFTKEKYVVCKNLLLKGSTRTNLIKKLKDLLNNMNNILEKGKFVFDIATDFTINPTDLEVITNINLHLTANEHLNINKITDYKNKKNYFGEQYHKFRTDQINANKWWENKFLKSKFIDFDKVREELLK